MIIDTNKKKWKKKNKNQTHKGILDIAVKNKEFRTNKSKWKKAIPVGLSKSGLKEVSIFTDGSCLKNPNGAGAGCAILMYGKNKRIVVEGERTTTNNRMELLSAIIGLKALKYPCSVTLFSDSQYVVRAIEDKWVTKWQGNGWKTAQGSVKNIDLWEQLIESMKIHEVKFKWIKGHNGHPINELADRYAREHAVKLKRAG